MSSRMTLYWHPMECKDLVILTPTGPEHLLLLSNFVYFEVSASAPYQIRKIEELNKVICLELHFSLTRTISIEDLSTTTDNSTQSDIPQIRHRELFLSRQLETLPATHIRGKCTVTLHNDTESCSTYLSKDDSFFFQLVYDPVQKTCTVTCTMTPNHVPPTYLRMTPFSSNWSTTPYKRPCKPIEGPCEKARSIRQMSQITNRLLKEDKHREELRWMPNSNLTPSEIDSYLLLTRSLGTLGRAYYPASSLRQPTVAMSAAAAGRDSTLQFALDTLHSANYDVSRALQALTPDGQPVVKLDEMESWSASEGNLFEEALEKYGKCFYDIQSDFLPWKHPKSLIEFYYMWKTTDHYIQQKRLKAAEAEHHLKQVYIPNYNKPNPAVLYPASAEHQPSNCEGCKAASSSQWYALGPATSPLKVCTDCWNYWKRYGDLKSASILVYNAAVRSILLYGSETWPLRAEDVKRLSVFDHRCLRSIARIWWEHRISNSEIRRMVFGRNNSPSIDELTTLHRLRWLGHVSRMLVDRLPRRALFAQPYEGWKRARGGQPMTWQRSMKAVTSKLSCADRMNDATAALPPSDVKKADTSMQSSISTTSLITLNRHSISAPQSSVDSPLSGRVRNNISFQFVASPVLRLSRRLRPGPSGPRKQARQPFKRLHSLSTLQSEVQSLLPTMDANTLQRYKQQLQARLANRDPKFQAVMLESLLTQLFPASRGAKKLQTEDVDSNTNTKRPIGAKQSTNTPATKSVPGEPPVIVNGLPEVVENGSRKRQTPPVDALELNNHAFEPSPAKKPQHTAGTTNHHTSEAGVVSDPQIRGPLATGPRRRIGMGPDENGATTLMFLATDRTKRTRRKLLTVSELRRHGRRPSVPVSGTHSHTSRPTKSTDLPAKNSSDSSEQCLVKGPPMTAVPKSPNTSNSSNMIVQ
ncbi:hypothetical protein T265_09123 [Opisthorchis viverrini]|uniref:BAH domain protein n=1 Tax=Opisthorchis viverrini TaxID=6198 RepID=A0A074ZB95_OPIVI|nr:hypothetical protein T265_09123 [Opisthorchis viverrini]KER22847.1 hypothetical protein T265_09123 [Opisthorchis viverrini]